ncbi:MAG: hypothetical protein R3D62_20180 [Xanthobacteraceae bacterium]
MNVIDPLGQSGMRAENRLPLFLIRSKPLRGGLVPLSPTWAQKLKTIKRRAVSHITGFLPAHLLNFVGLIFLASKGKVRT